MLPMRFHGWVVRGCLLLASIAFLSAGADRDLAGRIVTDEVAHGRAYEELLTLADRFGMRLSGSPGYEAAARWAVEEFRRNGADRAWTEKVMVPHWVRGVERGEIVSPAEAPMALTALGMSDPTPAGGVTAEVVEVHDFDELRAAGEKVKGKIVLYNRPILPDARDEHGYGFVSGLRHGGASEAAKLGAVAMLIRSLGTANFRLPHTGMTHYEDGVPHIAAAAISAEDADRIHRFLAGGEPVRVHLELGCRNLPDVESVNVLAEIRGSERPEEIVLIGAHLDAWDLGSGAIDDAAGCAMILETMRLVKALGLKPHRTIRAVLFANEENGLRGGKAYAEGHKGELARHVAAIEVDSGGSRPLGFGVKAGPGWEEVTREIATGLSAIGADQITAGGGGADISPMAEAGVPMLGERQDTTHYFDYHHSAADTPDKVDPADLAKGTAALAVMACGLADVAGTLPRIVREVPSAKAPS